MCFVWIWEQTAIISLYNINWLICVTETECLLRGTDCLCINCETYVACLSPLRAAFGPRPVHDRLEVGKVALRKVFLPALQFSLSVSFQHCSILIFIYMLLLPDGRSGEAWQQTMRFCSSGSMGRRVLTLFFSILATFGVMRLMSCVWCHSFGVMGFP